MLAGSVAGGFIAQQASLGVPFVLRALVLLVMFVVAFRLMHDIGFTPERGGRPLAEMRKIASASIEYGWRVPAVKWLMVESLFTGGVGIYAFYALQPYLLELYGDPQAYQIAGLVAAIVAGAQILGGLAAPRIRRLFHRRTSALIAIGGAQRGHARPDRRHRELLGRDRADRRLGSAVRRLDADPPDLSQRPDPVAAAGDDPLLRLADGLDAAASGPSPCSAGPPTCGATRRRTWWARGSRSCRCRSSSCRGARTLPRTRSRSPGRKPKGSRHEPRPASRAPTGVSVKHPVGRRRSLDRARTMGDAGVRQEAWRRCSIWR